MQASGDPFSLCGKTVLVTGASSGIGRQAAISCAERGAVVIVTARREEALRQTLGALPGEGHRFICADLTRSDEREALVGRLPALDGIVHCAGVSTRMPCKLITEEHIRQVMDLTSPRRSSCRPPC